MIKHFKNHERAKEVCIVAIFNLLISSLQCYETAIEANPKHASAHYALGEYTFIIHSILVPANIRSLSMNMSWLMSEET